MNESRAETPPLRETSSSIVQVYEGSGAVTIAGETLRFTQGDIIAVPAWKRVSFESDPGRTMYLFRMHDRPFVRSINAYRADDGAGNAPA